MANSSHSPDVGAVVQNPWFAMGQRLRNRRIQLGFRKGALVAHLGVSVVYYDGMEAGSVEISPVLLGRLSELLKVPVLYFFEDMHPGDAAVGRAPAQTSPVSDEECLKGLISAFRALDPDKQRYLLQLAQALAQEADGKRAGAM
jgi:transcriptional regulator with XRE-family HTH domain